MNLKIKVHWCPNVFDNKRVTKRVYKDFFDNHQIDK